MPRPDCFYDDDARIYEALVADRVWGAYIDAECFREGRWRFASFDPNDPEDCAEVKIDGEQLYMHSRQYGIMLAAMMDHPCVQNADVLTYVPSGMRLFMNVLGGLMCKDVAQVERVPGGNRYALQFADSASAELAANAEHLVIGEDVVSTLGSIAGVRRLLPRNRTVHSIAHVLRGVVEESHREGLADHYLVQREVPLRITAAELRSQFGIEPVTAII